MDIFKLEAINKAILRASKMVFAGSSILFTSNTIADEQLEEVVVTAQKRVQNAQDIAMNITTLVDESLSELNIKDFADYVLQLPSVSSLQRRPGMGQLFMRGISDGGNANQSGQQPSVAIYVDEAPVTAIGDNLDVHIYDIERIEVLNGPQGTLFGASAQAGNLRIITKKPGSEFDAGGSFSVSSTHTGSTSDLFEAFINIPLSDNAAVRIVGFSDNDGGYIDAVADSITYPVSGITRTNEKYVKNDFNEAMTSGYRAALRIDLNDSWSLDANVMGQETETKGIWDHDPDRLGDYKVGRFFEDSQDDDWTKFAATISGDIGFADITFTTSVLERDFQVFNDYSHYSVNGYVESYYTCYTYYFGDCVDPSIQYENYTVQDIETTELRIASKDNAKLNWILGTFYSESDTGFNSQWHIPPIHPDAKVPTTKDLYYQTDQRRSDEETAYFGELYYQATDRLLITLGQRKFENETKLKGFSGTVWWPSSIYGSSTRPDNVNSNFKGDDTISKLNLSYDINDDTLVYVTHSEGYRPGGANRTLQIGAFYEADFLENREIGFKHTSSDGRFRFNGASYQMDWDDIQLSWFDPSISLLTLVDNVGKASSDGFDIDATYLMTDQWKASIGYAVNDATLKEDYYLRGVVRATDGQDLPFAPDKKYTFNLSYDYSDNSYGQINYVKTGGMWSDLMADTRQRQAPYGILNASWTLIRDDLSIQFFGENLTNKVAELYKNIQDVQPLVTVNRPRTIGIKFSWKLKK
ncbi:MAG: TonB-dependent receptor [Gammaproteobacteria bacterium]|nr:TonB-dependent receptor [Gammaproteobacteria bacterium]